jgi:hypothetical protein
MYEHEFTVIDSGECILNSENKWIVPKAVLDALGHEECVWLGMGDRAELVTQEHLEISDKSLEEMKELLLKMGF